MNGFPIKALDLAGRYTWGLKSIGNVFFLIWNRKKYSRYQELTVKNKLEKCIYSVGLAIVLGTATTVASAAEYITNAKEIVAAANWDAMETVQILIGERGEKYFYRPSKLTFKKNQPYKLEIINRGRKKHYFTAEAFFRSIATRKVQSADGEIKAPYFLALEVMPDGKQLDLYFVPVESGNYEVLCTIDDHKDKGMIGAITVE